MSQRHVENRNAKCDKQISRMIYTTNSPFSLIENEQFIILIYINMLHPVYQLSLRKCIGGGLLDDI